MIYDAFICDPCPVYLLTKPAHDWVVPFIKVGGQIPPDLAFANQTWLAGKAPKEMCFSFREDHPQFIASFRMSWELLF